MEVFKKDWMFGLNVKINELVKNKKWVKNLLWENVHLVQCLKVLLM